MDKPLIAIVGPTASGKTGRGVALALRTGGEIISGDSRQVYRCMDLGTGKDLEEYGDVPHHLIDIAPAGYKYNLYEYVRDFRLAYLDITSRNRLPILVGGTGLYVETVLKGIVLPDVPENAALRKRLEDKSLEELTTILSGMKALHNSTDIDTAKRAIRAIEIETYYAEHPEAAQMAKEPVKRLPATIIGVDIDRENRRKRITERLNQRLNDGMIEEVDGLLKSGINPDDLIYYGLEYKFLTLYLVGKLSKDEMIKGLNIAIHQFAKRQMTWFRGMERRGFKITWLPYDLPSDEFTDRCLEIMANDLP